MKGILPGTVHPSEPPPLAESLISAYRGTHFVVFCPHEEVIRIGHPVSPGLIALLAEHPTRSGMIITAYNPFSMAFPNDINLARQEALGLDLQSCGVVVLEAEGRDPAGEWPPEPSLLVLNASPELAKRILEEYQQHAIVWLANDSLPELQFHPAHSGKRPQ